MRKRRCWRVGDRPAQGYDSILRLRPGLRPIATFGHKLIELGPVLGHAQPLKVFPKRVMLLFEAPEGFGAVFVKRPVAACSWLAQPVLTEY